MNKDELIKLIEGKFICRPRNRFESQRNSAIKDIAIEVSKALEGYVIVPVEPKMFQVFAGEDAFFAEVKTARIGYSRDSLVAAYKAMISTQEGL